MKLWAALTRFLTTVPVLAKGKTPRRSPMESDLACLDWPTSER